MDADARAPTGSYLDPHCALGSRGAVQEDLQVPSEEGRGDHAGAVPTGEGAPVFGNKKAQSVGAWRRADTQTFPARECPSAVLAEGEGAQKPGSWNRSSQAANKGKGRTANLLPPPVSLLLPASKEGLSRPPPVRRQEAGT